MRPCSPLPRVLGVVLVAAAALGTAGVARAEVTVVRGPGAEQCPAGAQLERELDAPADAPPLTITFSRTPAGLRSTVRTQAGLERTLSDEGARCEGLARATVLAARLALDAPPEPAPAAASEEPREKPKAATRAPPKAESPPDPTRDAGPRTPRPLGVGARLMMGGGLATGVGSPLGPTLRAGALLTLGRGAWSVGVTAGMSPARSMGLGRGEVDVRSLGGGVEGCRIFGERIALDLCARGEGYRLEGTARGFDRAESHARPMWLVTALGRGRVRALGPLSLFLEAGAAVPIVRERFEIQGVGLVYDPPPVALTTALGAAVDFK